MSSIVLTIGYIVASYAIADFIAGFWHWIEDRYFEEDWPFIGKYIAKPNVLHHSQPTAFLNQGYWSRNYTTIIPAASAGAIFYSCFGLSPWLMVFAFASQANEIHAFSHMKGRVPKWVAMLQEAGVFASPRHHNEHHRSPFEIRYCPMSNWLNPFLDHFQVWAFAEKVLLRTFKIETNLASRSK